MSDRLTINPGLRYTLNFPSTEINGQTAVFNLQTQLLEYPGDRAGAAAEEEQLRPAARRRLPADRQDARQRRLRPGLDRDGGHHDAVHDADVPVPADRLAARARHHHRRRSCCRTARRVAPIAPTPTAGLGQGVFARRRHARLRLRAAVERVGAARADDEHDASRSAYVGSKITHVGIPDTNLNQLTVEQLAHRRAAAARACRIRTSASSRGRRRSAIRRFTRGAAAQAVSRSTRPSASIATTSARRATTGSTPSCEQRLSRGLSYSVSYTRSKLMDDASSVFDASILTGPVANYPVADSFNRGLRARLLDRRHPARLRRVGGVGSAGRAPGARTQLARRARRARQRLDASPSLVTLQSGMPVAVTQTTNFNAFAGFGTQRPNLVGDPELPADERTPAAWFNTAAFAIAPQFTLGSASRNPVRGPVVSQRRPGADPARSGRCAARALELRAEVFNLLNTPNLGNRRGRPRAPPTSARSRPPATRASCSWR